MAERKGRLEIGKVRDSGTGLIELRQRECLPRTRLDRQDGLPAWLVVETGEKGGCIGTERLDHARVVRLSRAHARHRERAVQSAEAMERDRILSERDDSHRRRDCLALETAR